MRGHVVILSLAIVYALYLQCAQGVADIATPDNDGEVLIKLARDLRDGTGDVKANLSRSVRFFEYVIERAAGSLAAEATWELYQLLESHPELQSRYSSWELLSRAAESGQDVAQHSLSVALATGVYKQNLVPTDPVRSLVLEYVSALSGNAEAALGVGHRLDLGLGTTRSCAKALPFYELAANSAAAYIEELGYVPVVDRWPLHELLDPSRSKYLRNEATAELVDYYANIAETGDASAATLLGSLFLTGARLIPVDIERAKYFLELAAQKQYAPACGMLGLQLVKERVARLRKRDHTHLQFLSHETETETDNSNTRVGAKEKETESETQRIVRLLRTGVAAKDVHASVGLGLAHYFGIGVMQNTTHAVDLLQKHSLQHAEAGFFLGELLAADALSSSSAKKTTTQTSAQTHASLVSAVQAYTASAQLGNMLAQHRLASLARQGLGMPRSCESALSSFKLVAEKGPWMQALNLAQRSAQQRNFAQALALYAPLAALGIEAAQFNAAYILQRLYCPASLPLSQRGEYASALTAAEHEESEFLSAANVSVASWQGLNDQQLSKNGALTTSSGSLLGSINAADASKSSIACEARALTLYGVSASQGNSDSYLAIGDMYYFGKAGLNASRAIATLYYQQAAELRNTQALFNLALMHQIGDGVVQDFHLAKRYYDLAAENDLSAKTARDIALFFMDIQKFLLEFFDCSTWSEQQEMCESFVSFGKQTMSAFFENALAADVTVQHALETWKEYFPSKPSARPVERPMLPSTRSIKLKSQVDRSLSEWLENYSKWSAQEREIMGWSVLNHEVFVLLLLFSTLFFLLGVRRLLSDRLRRPRL